jgi:hypothetical protein|tara:strand:- start:160 stop:564 length:405 start_codon:yes stop_codon:yes gene_type:complete
MSNEIIKESLFGDDESASNQILETLESKIEEKMESFRQEMAKTILSETTEEVEEDVAFVSVISECLENGGVVNVDLMDGERVEVNEDIASLLSEVHDNLPTPELQKSLRDTIFESREKYIGLLETIISEETENE